jgi:hypothetical protein
MFMTGRAVYRKVVDGVAQRRRRCSLACKKLQRPARLLQHGGREEWLIHLDDVF